MIVILRISPWSALVSYTGGKFGHVRECVECSRDAYFLVCQIGLE